jgi:hypothetical protein
MAPGGITLDWPSAGEIPDMSHRAPLPLPVLNPFRKTIVANPWDTCPSDVATINDQAFQQCLRGIQRVLETGRSAGLVIHGPAGAGKTHLLARLHDHLTPRAPSASGRPEYLFVWVRLQTSPRMIWRAVRRALVGDWFRPIAGQRSQFERILFHRLAAKRPAEGDLERWYEYMLDEHPEGLRQILDEICAELNLDRNTSVAFEHLAFRRHLRDLKAWLGGDSLPEAALQRLDLSGDEGTDEEREDQARQVVQMLCRLAGPRLPVVLCFDQVEALQLNPRETDALFAFGQLVSVIHDSTDNVLVISCMQSSFEAELASQIRGADHDRMTSLGSFSLQALRPAEARAVIAERLRSLAPEALPGAAERTAEWPLTAAEFSALFEPTGETTPRRLIATCAARFDVLTQGPDSTPLDSFLEDWWNRQLAERLTGNDPDQTESILRHALPALFSLLGLGAEPTDADELPDIPLVFQQAERRLGLSICTQGNMNSLAARLRRLKEQWARQRLQRLVVVRDPRRPLSKTATKARKYLEDLQEQLASVVHVEPGVLAQLDTLRTLLSDARSGDLAWQGETVPAETLDTWLRRQLSPEVRAFAQELLSFAEIPSTARFDTAIIEYLAALLSEQQRLRLQDAVQSLGHPVDVVVAVIQRHPRQFTLEGEPPVVLFRADSLTPPASAAPG